MGRNWKGQHRLDSIRFDLWQYGFMAGAVMTLNRYSLLLNPKFSQHLWSENGQIFLTGNMMTMSTE